MKDLKDYILESGPSETIESALENLAIGILDYFNQEGVIAWDERKMIKYVKGEEEPNYKEIVDEMIYELEEFGDKGKVKLLPILKKYETEEWKDSIDTAIFNAMKEYVKDLM